MCVLRSEYASELKKLREDHIRISAKLTSSLQAAQVAQAEADSSKAESRSCVMNAG